MGEDSSERVYHIARAAGELKAEAAVLLVAAAVVFLFPEVVTWSTQSLDDVYYLGVALGFLFGSLAKSYFWALYEGVEERAR